MYIKIYIYISFFFSKHNLCIYVKIITMYIYIYTHNRIEKCALPVATIMALWQLVNLGTRCTVTHCRIALWSHQSAQTASSERCIMQIVNVSLRDSTQSIRVLNRIYLERNIYIYIYIIALTVRLIRRIEICTKMGHDSIQYCPNALV